MRDMLRRVINVFFTAFLWLLVVAIAGIPAVFMNSIFGYMPLLFLVVLALISIGIMIRLSARVQTQTGSADVQCTRGKSVDIGLNLTNRSRLSSPKAVACIEISDLFGLCDEVRMLRFAISGKGTVDFRLNVEMPHLGCYSVGLKSVVLYDSFGIFRKTLPISKRNTVVVTPIIRSVDELQLNEDVTAEAVNETRVSVIGGSDYTGVRAYALGDPMKQIHWKLSAHTREYVTKVQESNRRQEFSVILDFSAEELGSREQLMNVNDCLVETALSILEEISIHDASGALLYCDRTQTIVRTTVSGREDDADLIRSFSVITPKPDAGYPDASMIVQREAQAQNRSSNVIVVTCRPTPDLLQELILIKRQHRLPALYFVVPSQWSSREMEAARSPLRVLDEADIPYFQVVS